MRSIIERFRVARRRRVALAEAERQLSFYKLALTNSVSDEFRAPLTIIRGSAKLLSEPGAGKYELQSILAGLTRATQNLEHLIQVILAAAENLSAGERDRPIALADLCRDVARTAEAGAEARLRVSAPADAQVIVTDPDVLELALRAVIANAVRLAPQSTPVEVSARRLSESVEIAVRDRGPGLSNDEQTRAFEPFAQKAASLKGPVRGLRLGLFAARRSLELVHGTIELRSAVGGGTETIITIPQ